MTGFAAGLEAWVRRELARVPRLQTGTVKAVDASGEWDLVTLENGKRMVTLAAVSVDDTVVWVSGPFPVCLGSPYSTP